MASKFKEPLTKVRIDKWLWAARFYKTRSIAKTAVDGGKVHLEGNRVKPSKEVVVGSIIKIKQGWDEKIITVTGLSDKRGRADDAARLYQETPESIENRSENAQQRKLAHDAAPHSDSRPNKKERRQIMRFNQNK